jgi:hypothetical protein
MSKRSREKRITTRGAFEPTNNEALDRAFAEAVGSTPPDEAPAYPFEEEDDDNA